MAHAQKPDLVFQRNGRVYLYRRGCQFSRLLAAEVRASAVVMLDRPCSDTVHECWLPTPFAFFPFTSPPVLRLVPSDSVSTLLPINSPIRIIVTAADVLHSWTVPRLGVKTDATPGRLNQVRFSIKRPGLLYGRCSEICGASYRFMPIVIERVSTN